ncbi:MAG TPA: hypothetical protein VMW29_02980 [Candidatus Bathyarchaeia archaeon]|nr:hypothetical protein [Candidatus Bathyarchaeia archaeon]
MSEDELARTLETVYQNQEVPLVFRVLAESVVGRVLENAEYMSDRKYGYEHNFTVEGDKYELTASKTWGGGLPVPGITHLIVFREKEIDAERTVKVHIKSNGEIFSYDDKRVIILSLPNGDSIEISASNYARKTTNASAAQLPEPKGAVTVIPASKNEKETFRHVLVREKGGGLISLVDKDGQVWDEVVKKPANEQQKTLFEMSCQKFLGAPDFSLQNLLY